MKDFFNLVVKKEPKKVIGPYPNYAKLVNFYGLTILYSPCSLHFHGNKESPLGVVNHFKSPKNQDEKKVINNYSALVYKTKSPLKVNIKNDPPPC